MHITPELEAQLNAESTEKAVDKVLDGIDAAKVREQVIDETSKTILNGLKEECLSETEDKYSLLFG